MAQRPGVPRLRRAAHLPGPAGRGRGAAHPPGEGRLRAPRRAVHRHLGDHVDRGHERSSGAGSSPTSPARSSAPPCAEENVIGETLIRATAEDAGAGHARADRRARRARRLRRPGPRPARLLDRDHVRPGPRRRGQARPARADHRPARRPRDLAAADRRRRGPVREGDPAHPAGRVAGQGPATAAGRCSRSGCTSSCPRATPCT